MNWRKIIASLCEIYAGTATQSLAWSPERERPVDRISAAGRASIDCSIGLLLWKSRDGLDSQAFRQLEETLFKLYRQRYGDVHVIATAIVSQALHEFVSPQCRRCQGTREVMEADLKTQCPECSMASDPATGLHRYTDTERAIGMNISYAQTKRSAHKIAWLLQLLGREERRQSLNMAEQLERR